MSAEIFLDTNIFIYHLDGTDRPKHEKAEQLVRDALATGSGCISYQVVQECLNVVLQKARVPLDAGEARDYLDIVLLPLVKVHANEALYHRALDLKARWRFGFYDSLIVAAALAAGCKTLLTEDMQDGQRIEGLIISNPFRR